MALQKTYIEKAFSLMRKQSDLYSSSKFWEDACINIFNNINDSGLESFRRDKDNLNFFVPTYGPPGNSFSDSSIKEVLGIFSEEKSSKAYLTQESFLRGSFSAFSDYRVFKATQKETDVLNLSSFSESSFGNPIEHFEIEGKFYSRSSLNYLLGISYLKTLMPDFSPNSVLEIGGGFGTLGEILYQIPDNEIKYINIDLPPMFAIAHEYIKNACMIEDDNMFLSSLNEEDIINISDLPLFSFLPSWEIEKLSGTIDLFVNFISFQEMEPPIVRNYLNIVSNLQAKIILLRNMKEGKQKATNNTVGVISPVMNEHYAKFLPEYDLIGSNTSPYGYTTIDGFNSELLVFKRKK